VAIASGFVEMEGSGKVKTKTLNKFLYVLRWQIAGVVYPLPILWFGIGWGTVAGSLIGALIFWSVDKRLTCED